jgi:hypothetical protein
MSGRPLEKIGKSKTIFKKLPQSDLVDSVVRFSCRANATDWEDAAL